MADRIDEIKNVSFITLFFNDESPDEIRNIIAEYNNGGRYRENIKNKQNTQTIEQNRTKNDKNNKGRMMT